MILWKSAVCPIEYAHGLVVHSLDLHVLSVLNGFTYEHMPVKSICTKGRPQGTSNHILPCLLDVITCPSS